MRPRMPAPPFAAHTPALALPLPPLPSSALALRVLMLAPLTPDFFFLERKYKPPMSNTVAFAVAASFAAGYAIWVEHCASINGHFPYPFLTIMSFEDRTKVYSGAALFALLVFRGLNALHK